MTPRAERFAIAGGVLVAVGAAATLILNAFQSNLVFFYSPSQVVKREAPAERSFRIGGMVEKGTLARDGTNVQFVVTDTAERIPVRYTGILPDLFREGQGVVAEGALDGSGVFKADNVLAKHDERYMPKDVADALKKQGHWKDEYENKSVTR